MNKFNLSYLTSSLPIIQVKSIQLLWPTEPVCTVNKPGSRWEEGAVSLGRQLQEALETLHRGQGVSLVLREKAGVKQVGAVSI